MCIIVVTRLEIRIHQAGCTILGWHMKETSSRVLSLLGDCRMFTAAAAGVRTVVFSSGVGTELTIAFQVGLQAVSLVSVPASPGGG